MLDLRGASLRHLSPLLYAVVAGSYLTVAVLGVLLRVGVSPAVVSVLHLGSSVLATLMVVQGTGGVNSALSFLYLLVILDGAIIGSGRTAMLVASACSVAYGGQLAAQLYGFIETAGATPDGGHFATQAATHVAGFLMMALLAGYLAELLQRARDAAESARTDLERIERLHGAVLESLPVGVLTCSDGHSIATANHAASRLLGEPLPSLIGRPLPAALARLVDELVLRDETLAESDIEIAAVKRHLMVARSPLSYGDDGPSPLEVLVLDDRTELKALERDLHAKERLASIGELAAGIAHEIRNPLAAISGAAELLFSGAAPANQEQLRAIVLREVQRLDRLVQDFLIYARPSPLVRARVDLNAMAGDLCQVLRHDGQWSGHELRVIADGEPYAEVDPAQIRQVLWNLLRNAVEASPPGAPVEVAIGGGANEVVVEVRDRGPGLDPAIQKHLFEPFRTTKPSGSGLGLATVHRIVQAHHGSIDVHSVPEAGTTVRVALPRGAV